MPRAHSLFALLVVLLGAAACAEPGWGQKAKLAGANTALGLGLVAARRAAIKDCWGACRPGTYCDKDSGLCVETPPIQRTPAGPPPPGPDGPFPEAGEYEVPGCGADAGVGCGADAGAR